MVRHIVMWRLKDDGEAGRRHAAELRRRLEALETLVPGIRELEVGVAVNEGDAASDLVLVTSFDDAEALAAYQRHPAHRKVVAFLGTVVAERRVVDYET